MGSNYQRKDNENTLDYLLRLTEIKIEQKPEDLEWSDIVNYSGFNCHYDSLRKALQPAEYGGYAIFKYLKNKYENESITDDKILKQVELAQRELFKERQKLRDEKNEYNALLREQSRMELFYERIDEAVDKLIQKKPRNIPIPIYFTNNDVKVVCNFADPHYGVEFDIRGFSNEIINKYNPEVFAERMWQLRDEILEFCKINNCKNISIVDLGDSVEGILHIGQLKSLRGNIVDDIMDYGEFIADWLESLSVDLYIDFYTSEGNHSDLRLLTGSKGDFPHENLERIYSRVIQRMLCKNPNVKIHKSLNGLNYFNVNGYDFLSAHGNNEKNIKNSIKEYEDTYGIKVNYFLVGHLHCKNEIEVARGKEVVQVRSIMGINEYSTTIKKTSEAGATMFTVHKNYGKKYVNEVKFQ